MRWLRLFSRPDQKQHRPVEAPGPLVARSSAELRQLLTQVADRLPEPGEAPFDPDPDSRPPMDVLSSLSYLRRVFLAMLIGRPITRVAKRAGSSRRLVYKVLRHVIYVPEPLENFPWWQQLGLVAIIDSPLVEFETGDRPAYRGFPSGVMQADDCALYCLVCHHLLTGVDVDFLPRNYDGGVLTQAELSHTDHPIACLIQAHVIGHFLIASDPIRGKSESFFEELDRVFLGIGRTPRTADNWQLVVPRETLHLAKRYRSHPMALAPHTNGEPINPADVRRRWNTLLGDTGTPNKKARGSGRSRRKLETKGRN